MKKAMLFYFKFYIFYILEIIIYNDNKGGIIMAFKVRIRNVNYDYGFPYLITKELFEEISGITMETLDQRLNGMSAAKYLNDMNYYMYAFSINTKKRMAHFLAQCIVECTNLVPLSESTNYSAEGILSTFKRVRVLPNAQQVAKKYAKKPIEFANYVYSNKFKTGSDLGNGSESSGDGWRYRGGGLIQITGRNTYLSFSRYVEDKNVMKGSEYVRDNYNWFSACYYWQNLKNLNPIADKANNADTITRVVNPAMIKADERRAQYIRILGILNK
jgi:putative chitinase